MRATLKGMSVSLPTIKRPNQFSAWFPPTILFFIYSNKIQSKVVNPMANCLTRQHMNQQVINLYSVTQSSNTNEEVRSQIYDLYCIEIRTKTSTQARLDTLTFCFQMHGALTFLLSSAFICHSQINSIPACKRRNAAQPIEDLT